MSASASTPPVLRSATLDRQRSLAITAPLQTIEANKSHLGAQRHDLRTYALFVLDRVVLGMRAQRGARLDTVETELSELVERCVSGVTPELRGRIVAYVIDELLNSKRRGPFVETLTTFDEAGVPRRVQFDFTLLESKDIGDDGFYLVASPQAIRLYTDLLARDVMDEQVANECLVRFLVERGEWQKAAEESARMELLSLEHEQMIRRALDQAKVNVRAVNWKLDLLPRLHAARAHVGDRVRGENSVLASLHEKRAQDEGLRDEDRAKLADAEERINQALCRHVRLSRLLLEANPEFTAAQDAQCYRPRELSSLAHLGDDLLAPLLQLPLGRIEAAAEELAEFVFRPEPRPLASLLEIVERLLQAEPEKASPPSEGDADLEPAQKADPFLGEEDERRAQAMLAAIAQPCLLSELLHEMEAEGLSLKAQDLVVTTLLKSISVPSARIVVSAEGLLLDTPLYRGDELRLAPQ